MPARLAGRGGDKAGVCFGGPRGCDGRGGSAGVWADRVAGSWRCHRAGGRGGQERGSGCGGPGGGKAEAAVAVERRGAFRERARDAVRVESADPAPLFLPPHRGGGTLAPFSSLRWGKESRMGSHFFFFFAHIHIFTFSYTVGMEKKTAVRRILKDREVEAVPAPSVLQQFIFVCKKVRVLPELGGNVAREAKQQRSVQRDPLELPTLSHAAAINTPRPPAV